MAFVPNRWINENVVLAHEIVHSFKYTGKRKGFLGIKLDFQKAYDKMEWNFLLVVLRAFRFSNSFINLIHQCLSTVEFTLLLNGGLGPSFSPSRGLRQGDPLSLYLFILCKEVIMRLINRKVPQKNLTGFKVSNTAPPISKLCYADDILLFCKAKSSKLAILRKCLEKFCYWLGQSISVEKSTKGASHQFMNQVKCCWGLNTLPQSTTYLGVPLFLSKSKS